MTASLARPRLRSGWWSEPRMVGAGLLGLLCLVGMAGLTQHYAFATPSRLKYTLTVAAPVLGILLVAGRRAQAVLVCTVVLIAPFSFVATFGGLPVTPLTILLVIAGVVTWANRAAEATTSPLSRAVPGFLLCLLFPFLVGTDLTRYALVVASGLAAGYVVAKAARAEGGVAMVLYAFVASAAVQAALALWEFTSGHRLNLYGSANGGEYGTDYFFNFDNTNRPSAAFPDPIALGNVLAIACPLVLVAVFVSRRPWARLSLVAAGVLIVLGLAITLSRLSWIGAAAGTLVAIVFLGAKRGAIALAGTVAVAAVSITLALSVGGPALATRFASITDPTSSQVKTAPGDIIRLQLQHVALEVGQAHPVAGVGVNRLTPYLVSRVPGVSGATHAHNTYYQLFAETGVIGLFGVLLLFLGAVACGVRGWRTHRLVVGGAFGALVAVLFTWTTDYTIRNGSVMALVAAVFGLLAASAGATDTEAVRQPVPQW